MINLSHNATEDHDMTVTYLDETLIQASRQTERPRKGQTVSGYGTRLPTSRQLRIDGRWHRVYAICISNAASAYVIRKGQQYFLPFDV